MKSLGLVSAAAGCAVLALPVSCTNVPKAPPANEKNQFIVIPLERSFDNDAFSTPGIYSDGDFDGDAASYPALPSQLGFDPDQTPRTIEVDGIPFLLGPLSATAANNLTCRGQTLSLPNRAARRLHALAAATGGDLMSYLEVGYADSSGDHVSFGVSDWCLPRLYNERVAWSFPYRHDGEGKEETSCRLYLQTVHLRSGRGPLVSLHLPNAPRLNIFALTLEE